MNLCVFFWGLRDYYIFFWQGHGLTAACQRVAWHDRMPILMALWISWTSVVWGKRIQKGKIIPMVTQQEFQYIKTLLGGKDRWLQQYLCKSSAKVSKQHTVVPPTELYSKKDLLFWWQASKTICHWPPRVKLDSLDITRSDRLFLLCPCFTNQILIINMFCNHQTV